MLSHLCLRLQSALFNCRFLTACFISRVTCSTDVHRDLIALTALIATNYPAIHHHAFFPPFCEIRSVGFLSYPILTVHPPSLHA
jgi:hypothetical protein